MTKQIYNTRGMMIEQIKSALKSKKERKEKILTDYAEAKEIMTLIERELSGVNQVIDYLEDYIKSKQEELK